MSDWPEVRISELATIDIGGTPSRAIPAFWAEKPTGFPWISIADLKGKYVSDTKEHITALGVRSSNVKLIPERTTVMSFKLTVGRTAITAMEMYCNEAIAIFQPKDGRLHAGWLYHALPRAAGSVVTDTAVKGATLNKAKMAEMSLQLPPPAEQAIIARVLDTLDTAIHETEAIIAKLKAVKRGLLHDLLRRGIDANGELRPPQAEAPHLYKESPLGWIPKEWSTPTLAQACSLIRDGTHLPPARVKDGPLLLSVRNMQEGRFLLTDEDTRVSEAFYRQMHKHWEVQKGDVLLAIVGATIGKTASVGDMPKFTLQRSVAVLRGKQDRLMNEFLHFYLSSHEFQTSLWAQVNQTAQPGIYLDQLGAIAVRAPTLLEQEAIQRQLQTAQRRIDDESDLLQKLRKQKSGLMDDLLTGRVRVTPFLAAEQQGGA